VFYTYAHTKPDGTIFYIGKGTGNRAWKKSNRNRHWSNIVNKHGRFEVEILANWSTEQEAFEHEALLIFCFRKMGYVLANMTNGGEGISGLKLTEEHKRKIGDAHRGAKSHWFGKPKSEEIKQKISNTKLKQNLRGSTCINFKGFILATNIKTGEEIKFEGVSELNAFGFQNTNVYKCLNGKRKSHKGYTFKRLEK